MSSLGFYRFKLFTFLLVISVLGPKIPEGVLAMNLGVRCQADPDTVFEVVRVSAQAMPRWRSVRIVEGQRAVKAMVLNWRNYAVPIVIQVQTKSKDGTQDIVEVHLLWEQTMDPVNYPDVSLFMDTFWEQQKALGLNCVDSGSDVGL